MTDERSSPPAAPTAGASRPTCDRTAAQARAGVRSSDYRKVVELAGPTGLYEEFGNAFVGEAPTADDVQESVANELLARLKAFRIESVTEIEAGNFNIAQEIRESLKALFARSNRGEADVKVRVEFPVLADEGEQQRSVTIDLAMDAIQLTVKGAPPVHGQDGLLKEVGSYAKHPRQETEGRVDHFVTGAFAPAKEGEVLVLIDNSRVRGRDGIDAFGRRVKARPGVACHVERGKGVSKKVVAPGKLQLVANRTGVVAAAYEEHDQLCSLDVRESVKIGEVGHRAGGHVAARGRAGQAEELELEDVRVEIVPRAFQVRTLGTVTVLATVFGDVRGGAVTADMINAEGKAVVAHDTLAVKRAVQISSLYAREIVLGAGCSLINSHLHARHRVSGSGLVVLGRNTLVLGNDRFVEPAKGGEAAADRDEAEGGEASGEDLFAGRQALLAEQEEIREQLESIVRVIREALLGRVRMRPPAAQGQAAGVKELLDLIGTCDNALARCDDEMADKVFIRLANALADLGIKDTLPLLQRFKAKRELRQQECAVAARLADLSPPLSLGLEIGELKDGSQLVIRCWQDEVAVAGIDGEIVVSRQRPAAELFRARAEQLLLEAAFDYASGRLDFTRLV